MLRSNQIRELTCRHTWSLWIKGVMPPGDGPGERPLAAYRSNCTRCSLFRVITVADGGDEPGTGPAICQHCFLPIDDPADALRWPNTIRDCPCGTRAPLAVEHGNRCRLVRTCGDCGATADFAIGG